MPMVDVASKLPFLLAICSLQGVITGSSWSLPLLVQRVTNILTMGLLATVFLTCDANTHSIEIVVIS